MPSIRKEIQIDAPAEAVWDALRDFGALHTREVLIDSDDDARRRAWSIVDEPYEHHNGVAQVFPEGDGCRFVWTTDLLAPDEVVEQTNQAMTMGIETVKRTLEAAN